MKLVRLYQSDKGIWHYEIERNGKISWSSLHTRDESIARAAYEKIAQRLRDAAATGHPIGEE